MNRFRLDARRFDGPLYSPVRNDTEQRESDDLADLHDTAEALVGQGFTVWLFERVRRAAPLPEAYDLRLVSRFTPEAGPDGG